MPGIHGIGAAILAGVAAVVASQDGDHDIVPFFVGLTIAGGIHAWATSRPPLDGIRRGVSRAVAGGWTVAALWIGVLLFVYQAACACSGPPRPPEDTYLGLTATVYHLVGLYGGLALILVGTVRARGTRPELSPVEGALEGRGD